jgi:hypothetical protein
MDPKLIVIDEVTYKDISEMPPDVRQKYEQAMRLLGDADNNQIPDAFETMNILGDKDKDGVPDVLENLVEGQAAVSSMKIVIDGKEFDGLENLPPEARARYEEAMGKMDANRNGIPDFVEGMFTPSGQPETADVSTGLGVDTPRRSAPLPASPTITPDTSNGWMLVLAGFFLLALCIAGAAGVWYFFLR